MSASGRGGEAPAAGCRLCMLLGELAPCVHPSPQPPCHGGGECQQPRPQRVHACDVLLSLLGASSSMTPQPRACTRWP